MSAVRIVVMGVAGCGKSTLAAALARRLGAEVIEGDDHHAPESIEKMRRGIALTDADREPWLDRLAARLAGARGPAVLTCSALKRRYRDRLRAAVPLLHVVFPDLSPDAARARVSARPGHPFPSSLVTSQFEALERPQDEPHVLTVPADEPVEQIADAVVRWLTVSSGAGPRATG